MSKAVESKAALVAEIKDKLQNGQSTILVDYAGINVQEVTALRSQLRKAGVEYKVYKNTLIARAANELNIEGLEPYLHGSTAIATSMTDPAAPAKGVSDYIAKAKKMEIKCGVLDGKVIDAKAVEGLAKMPPKEVVVAQLLGVMNAPIRNFASVLNGTVRGLVVALNAIAEKKGA